MSDESVLLLKDGKPVPVGVTRMKDLGYKEREDLQQWIITNPGLVEDGLLIVTEEFDRWRTTSGRQVDKRLDLLALDREGRLVVIELKRDDASVDTHLQALTYAALASRFTEANLADQHAAFLRKQGEDADADRALELLRAHCGGELDPLVLKRPRLVLIAGRFAAPVTASAVWLNEMGVDIKLVQARLWSALAPTPSADIPDVLTISTLYPAPGTEEITIAGARAERATAGTRTPVPAAVEVICEHRLIPDGTEITLDIVSYAAFHGDQDQFEQWLKEAPGRGHAVWTDDPKAPLRWEADGKQYRPGTLLDVIVRAVTGRDPKRSVQATLHWKIPDGRDLYKVAQPYFPKAGGQRECRTDGPASA
ncbi:endonuclease NucS domain-containing protein [Kitasatospora sp. NPDC059327]|uniref:endonuclease NucS domain-containing protein n=1 Tax=Kitasatospora sp. NPDC059327 TaxID=3346803 RepID=UPI0036CB2D86